MKEGNLFAEPKLLKNWAIKLANELGGQKVEKTPVLIQLRYEKIAELVDKFVKDHNEYILIMNEEEE